MIAVGPGDDATAVPGGPSPPTDGRSGALPAPSIIRTPDQRLRVFVSSTLEELAPERVAAKEAITQLRLTPVLFELGARPYPPRALYQAYLAQCDVFIGIYWQRYGWIAPGMAVSGLEDEYQLSGEKPRLIYLKTPAPEQEPRLQSLLDRVRAEDSASYRPFANSDGLRDVIANDLALLLTERFGSAAELVVEHPPPPVSRGSLIDAMPSASSDTLTFLYTDIEGSTRLWQQFREEMPHAIARHDALLREAVSAHQGRVFRTMGDAVCAVFRTASEALSAAIDGQQALLSEPWKNRVVLLVRMGIHTGAAEEHDGDFGGHTLNRVARLMSAAHGGQILLSNVTRGLLLDETPDGVTLRDLGEHRLKDLERPEHIYQVVAPGLQHTFPPLHTLDTTPTNLPAQTTSFVGRDAEVDAVVAMLRDPGIRLLTLLGPGGAGKTRLALRVGTEMLDAYNDGAFFVPLASIQDPQLVAPAVASALGMRDAEDTPLEERLAEYLRDREMLLILDNFEQILSAAPLVSGILAAAPSLRILVTSRSVLHLTAEHEYAVPPLKLPDLSHLPNLERLTHYDAVALFIQRARAVKPDFAVTNANAPAVAEICVRLDGLPLAIELAAARIRLFQPEALLKRLTTRLTLLTGGARDLPSRQQTLRGTMDWSYSLLSEEEQRLFARLAVFSGGWGFEAAEEVCVLNGDLDVLAALSSLVEQSLVRQEGGAEPRFFMFETIREYAHEELQANKEEAELSARHARYMVALVEEIEPRLWGPEQMLWIGRMLTEQDNVRAGFRWLLDARELEAAGRLLRRLTWFWWIQGQTREARRWAEDVLAMGTEVPPLVRARASLAAGAACAEQGDDAAVTFLEEARALAVRERDPWIEGCSLMLQGFLAPAWNDTKGGIEFMWQARRLLQEAGDEWAVGLSLNGLTALYILIGQLDDAEQYAEERDALARRMGDLRSIAQAQNELGLVALMRSDLNRAAVNFREAIALSLEVGQPVLTADILMGLAVVAVHDEPVPAARYFGAAEAIRETAGVAIWPPRRKLYDHALETLRAALGAKAFDIALAEGRAMTLEQAVEYSLGGTLPP